MFRRWAFDTRRAFLLTSLLGNRCRHASEESVAVSGYQCSACGKSFRLINALNHHIATRHGGKAKAMSVSAEGKLLGEAAAAQTTTSKPSAPPVVPAPSAAPTQHPAVGFPGALPGAPPHISPALSSAVPISAAAEDGPPSNSAPGTSVTESDADKKLFVCTVCQKTFRLEAALQHHYQAKHGMEMPAAATGAGGARTPPSGSTSSVASPGGPSPSAALKEPMSGTEAPAAGSQYVRDADGAQPQMPQYHIDVAPNAPEEGDIAVHWRLVNHCVLIGSVTDIQTGFVFEDAVLQIVVSTDFENPSPGDPDADFHTVRVYGDAAIAHHKTCLAVGDRVMVSGRLRLVPQFDSITNKYYHHPVVLVPEGSGTLIKMLS